MTQDLSLRELRADDKHDFIAVMAGAFADDPLFLSLYPEAPDAAERQAAMRPFLSFMFDAAGLSGSFRLCLLRNGRLAACALVDRPSRGFLPDLAATLATILRFLPLMAAMPIKVGLFLNRYMQRTRAAAPAGRHHYLSMIGVDPSLQGRGIGRRLMGEIIARAAGDKASSGVALDTENDANVDLYRNWGFLPCGRIDFGAITAHCMFRPAGPQE